MQRISLILILLSLSLVSCDKYKNYKKATVINTNNVAANGCGYIFHYADGSEEKPEYLPSAYQHDSLKVKVKLSGLGSVIQCDADSTKKSLPLVTIDDIVRDLD